MYLIDIIIAKGVIMIILASDHGGYELKEKIKNYLAKNYDVVDVGAFVYDDKDDYPKYAKLAMQRMIESKNARAIVLCGSGVGMSIICNRYKGIYATVGVSEEQVRLARQHNNINVLNLGGRNTSFAKAKKLIEVFLNTDFENGRHTKRLNAIDK